jgi:hypothetical protein
LLGTFCAPVAVAVAVVLEPVLVDLELELVDVFALVDMVLEAVRDMEPDAEEPETEAEEPLIGTKGE